jgi:predicted secreted Zn-dependent protease
MSLHRLAALLVLEVAIAVHAEPLLSQQTSYYYIDGGSALLLTEQINQKGPEGVDGKRHPARTKWGVQWKFRHNIDGDVCKMEKVVVAVGVTTTRPRWSGETDGPAALRDRWKKLTQAVDRNQAYHKEQAASAAREIEAVLIGAKPTATCEELTEAANKAASDIVKKYNAASEEHDRRTDYGRRDGASLI